jgi:hypothetical protein
MFRSSKTISYSNKKESMKNFNIVIFDYASGSVIFDTVPPKYNTPEKIPDWLMGVKHFRESDIYWMAGDSILVFFGSKMAELKELGDEKKQD